MVVGAFNTMPPGTPSHTYVVYRGPIETLRGKTALACGPTASGHWFLQFDDPDATFPESGTPLGYGWHPFPKTDIEERNDG